MDEEFKFYTVLDAAIKADESMATIRNRIKAGVIKAVRTRLGYLITPEDIDAYLNRRGPKNGRGYFRDSQLMPESHAAKAHEEMTQEAAERTDWEASQNNEE
ncbi:helix-turn-helix domain-containing protein [Streptomyces sp. NPDC058954]|uniref:helix-turn-helix domain-containing protein n=1 Tax=Streptomyces sp. NPDC058954 TaxID=3346677 RepID=UPI00369752E0